MSHIMRKIPTDIQNLDDKIRRLQQKETSHRQGKVENEYSYAAKTGFRVGTELVSGVIVGGALGWVLDYFCHTEPWLLILFLLFGGIAGFLNVYRFVKKEEQQE